MKKLKQKFFIKKEKLFLLFMCILSLTIFITLTAAAAEIELEQPEYQSFKLGNGLQVMVFPDHSIPLLRYSIYYNVGSIDEKEGQTGISHFLEHLMFLGTENLPEGEIDDLISSVGGQLNAATSFDYTYYYHEVPSSMLELVMALESDRMQNLRFNKEEINREREVIKQERRMRTENNIFSRGFEEIKAEAFPDSYLEHNVIGWLEDINNISKAELKNYYQRYYSPNNALIVVSGDVEAEAVKNLAQKYYADYQSENIVRKYFELPEQNEEKTHKVHLQTNVPYALQLYKIPPADNLEVAALEIFIDILANNQSSRLKEKLQKEEGIILDSGAFMYPLRTESFALVYFIPSNQNVVEQAQQAFDRELQKVFAEGITTQEFEMVKKQYQKSLIFSQRNIYSAASNYALSTLRFNKTDLIAEKIDYINSLSKEEVVQIAQKYFNQNQRTKGYILPKNKGGAQQ
ncbi:zinc protease [Halanaerobium saccharolyticum]|uniref:Zinc protease n=1 Tax=Halanaerobium saccharolyticum TaxID=43595 RepID=A0A4R7Z5E4_9FIRM|nr:pitrilysin family protein [Halanaerobium saccharolyticum]RAK09396.1 zinc protease [Halanaerobium saccharolyticum]TDW06255.1 zinc protease [Halanaerobium saccharolyticum]TDX61049.1 zinc protease [Halanaerobium saccharolyticum]